MQKILTFLFLYLIIVTGQAQNLDNFHNCPMEGKVIGSSPTDKLELEALNRLKNRYNIPRPEDYDQAVTLEAMLGQDGVQDRGKFNTGKAATIEGYVVYAGKRGSEETCNCKTSSVNYQDQHIEIALTPDEPKDGRTITVEITPRLREIMRLQNVDWTHAQIGKLIKRKVRISGWLFYDDRHEKDACTFHPEKCGDVSGYNRQTCWEIHPITYLKDITNEGDDTTPIESVEESSPGTNSGIAESPSPPPPPIYSSTNNNNSSLKTTTMEPLQYLILILLGGILGSVGQLLRIIVGLKKSADKDITTDYKKVFLGLVLAFAVGGVAGVLAAVNVTDVSSFDKTTIFAFIAAGYAGTDFIEGFMKKNKV